MDMDLPLQALKDTVPVVNYLSGKALKSLKSIRKKPLERIKNLLSEIEGKFCSSKRIRYPKN
jgi:hypothetical protein